MQIEEGRKLHQPQRTELAELSSATAPAALGLGDTHPSTNQAQNCLTSVIEWELVFQCGYGRRAILSNAAIG